MSKYFYVDDTVGRLGPNGPETERLFPDFVKMTEVEGKSLI
jgi:hypothetical protein